MERPLFEAAEEQKRAARAAWIRALELTAPIRRNEAPIFPALIDALAERFGDRTALVSETGEWSYRALARRMNRYARWSLDQGIGRGDVVCLVMPSGPDYLAAWLGLTRVGAVAALVNINLAGAMLARAIAMVAPQHILAGAGLAPAITAILPQLANGVRCWAIGESCDAFPSIDDAIDHAAGDALTAAERAAPSLEDRALYLYTSGTVGFPKAAMVSHRRLMEWSHWFAGIMGMESDDRMYDCLPMYHGIGGIAAIGAALVRGGSVALRPRFSARTFWQDVTRWDCTLFQYVGELCRYLVQSPPDPLETAHRIRLCCGNGLSRDIWERFQTRFRIPRILEFYAATEGAFSLYNCEGKVGSVGRVPSFLAHRAPAVLIRLDPDTIEPLRGGDGRCIRCAANEVGEAIGRIVAEGSGGAGRFEGYTDEAASSAKLLHDVFAPGDCWFRTGDLMRQDAEGFFYFVDRLSDSYRWKGETVSASEVAATIASCPGVAEAAVYGVRVPGHEGRAGMAAVVAAPGFDLGALMRALEGRLPDYARPLFLRLTPAIETTATFRPRKQELARDGFDPSATADAIYFNDRAARKFVPLDAALHRRIVSGEVRL
jgi:fatty-acyl-CoA synthase